MCTMCGEFIPGQQNDGVPIPTEDAPRHGGPAGEDRMRCSGCDEIISARYGKVLLWTEDGQSCEDTEDAQSGSETHILIDK